MLRRRKITEAQAAAAVAAGEFPDDIVRSHALVAVVLTQDWCPQWSSMSGWLDRLAERGEPADLDVDVHELVYNRIAEVDAFLRFKEKALGNREIPYVRYYVDGRLVAESNFVGSDRFLARFRAARP